MPRKAKKYVHPMPPLPTLNNVIDYCELTTEEAQLLYQLFNME